LQAGEELLLRPGACTIVVEGIADAENMGSIVRNAAAFGAAALVSGGGSTSPFLRRSVRVSMGAIFSLPVRIEADLLRALTAWKQAGLRLVATTPRGGMPRVRDCFVQESSAPLALLFGSEGEGLSQEALELCDARFTIPMQRGIDSLNVAHTVALALYDWSLGKEARREEEARREDNSQS
jgi:tRNA G18 (ribose-2'-O)-methylase SpoU